MITTPTSDILSADGCDAGCQMVMRSITTNGNRLYASPANASMNMEIAPANVVQSGALSSFFSRPVACHTHHPAVSVASGSSSSHGERGTNGKFANHFSSTVALINGVAKLTSATPRATHISPQRVQVRDFFCSAPSVLSTSQDQTSET